ncbi:hypothetical protein CYY_002739 [Polysphondylium violaceum]|uniref:Ricin B lectin domain-containing protein n=1 Tax=Polysphondylium violaceum TaxID=133409 RepID=A0A8J4PXZ5_9MYCE|nr:hypothetical protein CYY_002739 [Polysphondylium violaceum]
MTLNSNSNNKSSLETRQKSTAKNIISNKVEGKEIVPQPKAQEQKKIKRIKKCKLLELGSTGIKQLNTWVYIQNRNLDANGNPLCLNVEYGYWTAGTQIIVYPVKGTDNELWQVLPDGHILSRVSYSMVLGTGQPVEGETGYQLETQDWQNTSDQIWTLADNSQIKNQDSGFYISVDTQQSSNTIASGDNAVAVLSDSQSTWDICPSLPLDSILSADPVGWVDFSQGGDGTRMQAYQAISQFVGYVDSIRDQYVNLNAPLDTFISIMSQMPIPEGVTNGDFAFVKLQLSREIQCAQGIVNMFNNYTQFHIALFADNSARLNQLSVEVGLQIGSESDVSGSMLQLFSGILYTVLSALPGEAPILGNIIQSAINVAVSIDDESISPDPFQVALADLWNTFSDTFEGLLTTIGSIETTILSDWGKMQSTFKLIMTPNGPNSLAWLPGYTSLFLSAGIIGYENSILQMLMPTIYQIYYYDYSINESSYLPEGLPDYCKYQIGNIMYFIASNSENSIFPTESLMKRVWANGVSQYDFYKSSNGWNFPTAVIQSDYFKSGIFTFSNNTPYPLKLSAGLDPTTYLVCGTYSSVLGPWNDSYYYISVTDLSDNPVATIGVNVDYGPMYGAKVSMDPSGTEISHGYLLGGPTSNQGSYSDTYSGSINVSINLDVNNPPSLSLSK